MFSDAFALGLSFFAIVIGNRMASATKTYGYKRFEMIAALFNGLTLMLISVFIFWEALQRFYEPQEVSGGMMMIAFIGLCVNIVVAYILMKGNTNENLNMRSAFLHVLADMLGSIGAIVAGVFIYFFNWNMADPIASSFVATLVFFSGWRVTRHTIHVLMEGTPRQIDYDKVKNVILQLPDVKGIHDLHIWSLNSEVLSFSCHLVVGHHADRDVVIHRVTKELQTTFHIKHVTVQVEGEHKQAHCQSEFCFQTTMLKICV